MKKKLFVVTIVIIAIAVALAAGWILTQKEALAPILDPPALKDDLIRLDSPRPNEAIKSPLIIVGEARGNWFFEASFPIVLVNWDGLIIAQGIATAKENWMTAEYVPFEAKLDFTIDKNTYSNKGWLILKKDNPSGLPAHDNSLEVPIIFDGIATPSFTACTQEAKQCPDGSYVGRTEPNCEFAKCPIINPKPVGECQKDSDCSSSQYECQEIQGYGTACSSTDPLCTPTHIIIKGECRIKTGGQCKANSDCSAGNLCNKNICISPLGRECDGTSDTSCPADFECVQGCGPPVARQDDLPPSYFCQLKGYIRPCPICLAKNTLINTPLGAIAVQDMQAGALVWTANKFGKPVLGKVVKVSKTSVSPEHKMVELILANGNRLLVSPKHPTIDARTVGNLVSGDLYNGVLVVSSRRVSYNDKYTYDILPSGETGFYWANDILIDSTLH